jgi:hypothetical protein
MRGNRVAGCYSRNSILIAASDLARDCDEWLAGDAVVATAIL